MAIKLRRFRVKPGSKVSLADFDPRDTYKIHDKETAALWLERGVQGLAKYQDMLYAQNTYALLVIFQAMDAAGKDSTIKHVMSGVNPQGVQVFSFKSPSHEERDHDYLWRSVKALPERGRIGIHNRSYYEEVLVTRVHPEILETQQLPARAKKGNVWKRRFREINNFERYLVNNGTVVLKFFLNVSKDEQKKRFLERIDQREKNWKFSAADVKVRADWDKYMRAYEDAFAHTSTKWAPWYVIPADHKWFARLLVAFIIYRTLKKLDLAYPTLGEAHRAELLEAKRLLEAEKA
jgi:PPK2 family polyphosphate:nucleotide phosphotransferase